MKAHCRRAAHVIILAVISAMIIIGAVMALDHSQPEWWRLVSGDPVIPAAVLERLETEEAFRGMSYRDSRGHPTIGYGTKLPITKAEGAWLLETRLADTHARLAKAWKPYGGLSQARQGALLDMAYEWASRDCWASGTCWRPLSAAIGRRRAWRRWQACGRLKCRAAPL